MINITKLLWGLFTMGDALRYSPISHRRPVVVWNITRRCNLHCVHCYADAGPSPQEELTTKEAKAVVADLASYGVPVILFSGGEPLLREDIFELMAYASSLGISPVLSTNGTLISPKISHKLKGVGVTYVGVSLDGVEDIHNHFRGKEGAFREALSGLHRCRDVGIRTGIRFTITKFNVHQVPHMFHLLEEGIDRLCFYHLVYTGRGSRLASHDLHPKETRQVVDFIFKATLDLLRREQFKEVLTVDNHTDGVYLYLKVLSQDKQKATEVYRLLKLNGGNSSGIGVAAIDEVGNIHPDQFWRHHSLGNVRETPFSIVWEGNTEPLLNALRNRKVYLKGRCQRCRYLEICGGNFRVRAEAVYGDVWAPDPACYLTDGEIGLEDAG